MNANAFKLLHELSLPVPKTLSLEHIDDLSPESLCYLRYSAQACRPNVVSTVGNVQSQAVTLADEIAAAQLITIEKVYQFTVSGTTLVRPDFSYTECVSGHLRALLRNGLCGARILAHRATPTMVCRTFQGWKATQGVGADFSWSPTTGLSEDEMSLVIKQLLPTLPQSHVAVLLEWFIAEDGLVFCDARTDGFDNFALALSRMPETGLPIEIQRSSAEQTNCRVDELAVDILPPPLKSDYFIICNGALLSHYVTRNLDCGFGIQLGVKSYD